MRNVTAGLVLLEPLLHQDKEILEKAPLYYSKCATAEAAVGAVLYDGAFQFQQRRDE